MAIQVHFLDQEDIIEVICEELQKKLASSNQSRTFTVQVSDCSVATGLAAR